jgi:beta propeller repeat protein
MKWRCVGAVGFVLAGLLTTAMLAIGVPPALAVTSWVTTQVTSGPADCQELQFSDGRVVWMAFDGTSTQIFTLKIGVSAAPSQVTTDASGHLSPQVSGDRVVWQGSDGAHWQIFTQKIGVDVAPVQLTSDASDHYLPQVSGDRVVWIGADADNGFHQVFTRKLGTDASAVELTTDAHDHSGLDVDGDRIVWEGADDAFHRGIFTQKVGVDASPLKLTADLTDNYRPRVDGDRLVWIGNDPVLLASEVFTWEVGDTAPSEITTDPNNSHEYAEVSGDRIVWQGWADSRPQVYTQKIGVDASPIEVSTDREHYHDAPSVSGDRVVWSAQTAAVPEPIYQVFTRDMASDTSPVQITFALSQQEYPLVSGDRIVWYSWDGTYQQISTAAPACRLHYAANAHGSVGGSSTQVVAFDGSGTPVNAVPEAGYRFVEWSDHSTTNPRTDAHVTADATFTASFAINTYTLTYVAGSGGTISGASPQTVNYNGSGTAITVVPATGYHFVRWSDGVTTATRTDTGVVANITATAEFAINTYVLTYTAGSGGTISGTSPQTVAYNGSGTAVAAVANAGYHFVGWSDGGATATRTESGVVANITVSAIFAVDAPDTRTLVYTAGSGGTISGTSPQTVVVGGSGSAVTAVANTGYHFVRWSDGKTTAARTDSNVTADKSVSAEFSIDTHQLTYAAGTGGTISGTSPQTVNYNSSGTAVTAVPNAGYHFVRWSDGLAAAVRTDGSVVADKSVTAEFALNATETRTLTYAAGTGGTVSGTTVQTVAVGGSGTAVTAVPNSGYHFVSWSDGATTATRTDLVVLSDLTVTATFAKNPLPKATVYTPHAASTMYRNHHYTIYGYVAPRHTSGTYLVTLKFYLRNSKGVYVYHHSVSAKRYYYSTTKTKYSVKTSLSSKGKWRVRAYHSDSGHAPSYSGYDYITVK